MWKAKAFIRITLWHDLRRQLHIRTLLLLLWDVLIHANLLSYCLTKVWVTFLLFAQLAIMSTVT